MTHNRFFLAAVFFILLAGPYPARAVKVEPNPNTLSVTKAIRVLVLDDKLWNLHHEVPKEGTLNILKGFDTAIGFASFAVMDTATNITLDTMNNYDVVIFNYCDNLYHAKGTEFETVLKQWFATGNKGYMGYHTSGVFYTQPAEGEEWAWYDDSVTSIRFIERSGAHTNGTLIMTEDDSLKQLPILDGLGASFECGDVWLSLETEPPNAAPTWPDCKVLYYYDKNNMPQIWIRGDDLGNRYFFSMQFHDSHEKGIESDFWHNLLLRALEYVGGERETVSAHGYSILTTNSYFHVTNNRQINIHLDGCDRFSVLSPIGELLYSAEGAGKKTFAPSAFDKDGLYIVHLKSKAKSIFRKLLIY